LGQRKSNDRRLYFRSAVTRLDVSRPWFIQTVTQAAWLEPRGYRVGGNISTGSSGRGLARFQEDYFDFEPAPNGKRHCGCQNAYSTW
jgi:hypothetical protein